MIYRLMIVDDSLSFRKSAAFLAQSIHDIQLVGEFDNGNDALISIPELLPHIVLVDILMPGMNGIVLTRLIRQRNPEIRIIAVTGSMNDRLIQQVRDAGASAVIFKDQLLPGILQAITPIGVGKCS